MLSSEVRAEKNNPNIPDKNFIEKLIMPPCEKGDILYVRETWNEWEGGYVYKAWPDGILQPGSYGTWRPSTNMPKAAVHIWLKVTDVRVERLQDITEEQTRAEGVLWSEVNKTYNSLFEHANVSTQMELYGTTNPYIFEFKYTWNKTVDKKKLEIYGWSANPWVWVIEFERCEKPEEIE